MINNRLGSTTDTDADGGGGGGIVGGDKTIVGLTQRSALVSWSRLHGSRGL